MKLIPLTQGQFAKVDDADFEYLNKFKWHAHKNKTYDCYYAMRCIRTVKGASSQKMHREILGLKNGDKLMVDHIDHNGLNNQRYNIRIATREQNQRNRVAAKNSTSKHVGVFWHKRIKKWQAQIKFDKKTYHLGYFYREEDASKAYKKKSLELNNKTCQ